MEFLKTTIEEVVLIEPTIFEDERGYFFEVFKQKEFNEIIRPITFVQDNESFSKYGVVRALHFQKPPYAQSKLVRCVKGHIFDVAVDVRLGSPTYGEWVGCHLTGENHHSLFIPRGFAHGFSVLSDSALVNFKCDNYYHHESEVALAWNDPTLDINWHVPNNKIIVSRKDHYQKELNDLEYIYDYNMNLYDKYSF